MPEMSKNVQKKEALKSILKPLKKVSLMFITVSNTV